MENTIWQTQTPVEAQGLKSNQLMLLNLIYRLQTAMGRSVYTAEIANASGLEKHSIGLMLHQAQKNLNYYWGNCHLQSAGKGATRLWWIELKADAKLNPNCDPLVWGL